MTDGDMLTLDLSSSSKNDEGLLVPFRNPYVDDDFRPFLSPGPALPRRGSSLARLFRRTNTKDSQDDQKSSLLDGADPVDESGEQSVKLRQITFSFPNAPVEQAEEWEDPSPSLLKKTEPLQPVQSSEVEDNNENEDDADDNESESEDEDDDDDDEESKTQEEHQDMESSETTKPPKSNPQDQAEVASGRRGWSQRGGQREQSRSLLENDASREPLQPMEGYGNGPHPDEEKNGLGRFFRRISRRSDLKTMKVATEDTKDQKTLTETLTHAVAVVLVPELYLDEEEGEGNLGYYRTISMEAEEPSPKKETRVRTVMTDTTQWTREVAKLTARVESLEKDLKSSQLETESWRLRATELEAELRNLRHGDGDSSEDNDDNDVDEEWTDFGTPKDKDELLLDFNKEVEPETKIPKQSQQTIQSLETDHVNGFSATSPTELITTGDDTDLIPMQKEVLVGFFPNGFEGELTLKHSIEEPFPEILSNASDVSLNELSPENRDSDTVQQGDALESSHMSVPVENSGHATDK